MAEKKKKGDKYQLPDIKNEDERKKALNDTLAKIEKDFGKGAVMRLGDTHVENIPVLPTGSIGVDIALGVGGIPCGRIVELFGPESSGKTTLALHIVAEAQKLGGIAGYIDAEHALDPIYAKKLGVNIDELYISQPDDGEQALEIAEAMVRSGVIDIVVIDSVAALTPRAEIAGDMSDSQVGILARLMSKALRKLTAVANKTNCTILFINQLRDKIGGMVGFGGPSETTTGGRALKFYASVRLDIRRIGQVKVGDVQIGSRTKVKVAKNKVAPPFKICEFDIMFGEGISKSGELLDMAEVLGIVKKGGAWYSYGDLRLGQGRENAKTFIAENPEISDEIETKLREHYEIAKVKNLALAKETVSDEDEKTKSKSKSKKSAKAQQEEESFEYDDADQGEVPADDDGLNDDGLDDDLLADELQFEE